MAKIKIDWEISDEATNFENTNHVANYFGIPIVMVALFLLELLTLFFIPFWGYLILCFAQVYAYKKLLKKKVKPSLALLYLRERRSNIRRALPRRYTKHLQTRDEILRKEITK